MVRPISVAEDIVPIGEFKAQAARLLDRLRTTGHPLIVTQHGKPAAVMLSPVEYDRLRECAMFVQTVSAGLADAETGRTMDTATLRRRLEERQA
ncbi:MAG: type II toxin-antitoxin system Phd/YefM family antitoxin [Candidatus Dadabacteria bacterium]|nr:MAG: type II toxin-antitoxin system Phd/YefM family antitoxin [Candidatus Dadabacteria bacterium]